MLTILQTYISSDTNSSNEHTHVCMISARRKGAVAVEFALVAPVILLLVMACADFGRIAHYQLGVANAARTGAELGATMQLTEFTRLNWESTVYQAALSELANLPSFDEAEVEFALSTTTDPDNINRVTIDVGYPFRTSVNWPGLPAKTMLHKRVEFRQFR